MSASFRPSRRFVLAGSAALAAVGGSVRAAAGDLTLFVGTYSTDEGSGIFPLTYSAANDSWAGGTALANIENASFGAYSRRARRHYLTNENANSIGVYSVDGAGAWRKAAEVSSEGGAPCYLAVDASETYLATANYMGGDIAVFRLDGEGNPTGAPVIRQNHGSGPVTDRQEGPHAHCVKFAPDQQMIYSVDLGTDQVLGYSFDAATGAVGESFVAFQAPAGAGPRHLAFHPGSDIAYLCSELSNQLFVLRRHGDGTWGLVQMTSTLPDDFDGHSQVAHLVVNSTGTNVYVSNRGHNSLAVFSIADNGAVTRTQIIPTGGDWPRFFLLLEDQKRLLVAHERGGTIKVFSVAEDGTLTSTGQSVDVPHPVFISPI